MWLLHEYSGDIGESVCNQMSYFNVHKFLGDNGDSSCEFSGDIGDSVSATSVFANIHAISVIQPLITIIISFHAEYSGDVGDSACDYMSYINVN